MPYVDLSSYCERNPAVTISAQAVLWLLVRPLPMMVSGNSGMPDPDLMLGQLQTYASEQAARSACGTGNVVWAERHAGYYYKPGEARYSTASPGAFACQKDAAQANYWDSDPMAAVMGYHGKSFARPDPVGS